MVFHHQALLPGNNPPTSPSTIIQDQTILGTLKENQRARKRMVEQEKKKRKKIRSYLSSPSLGLVETPTI